MPDYVHHVLTGHEFEPRALWCGAEWQPGWHFQDPTHAILNARDGERPLVCPACSAAMVAALQKGTWTPDTEGAE
jgi:hypothetical protein